MPNRPRKSAAPGQLFSDEQTAEALAVLLICFLNFFIFGCVITGIVECVKRSSSSQPPVSSHAAPDLERNEPAAEENLDSPPQYAQAVQDTRQEAGQDEHSDEEVGSDSQPRDSEELPIYSADAATFATAVVHDLKSGG